MPPLAGFSNNPLITRDDLVEACHAFLSPLAQYRSPGCARIHIPVGTGTHFDETAAQLEGFARPLWAVGALLAADDSSCVGTTVDVDTRLKPWIDGFAAGCNPSSGPAEYWGEVGDKDQRMVEVEILSFALLASPRSFLGDLDEMSQEALEKHENIKAYLRSVNGKEFPQTNWLWFRVMANLALVKSCGMEYEKVKESMEKDLAVLDGFYVGGGWTADGEWRDTNGKQMDYYSGSFAIQYSQLMYAKYAADIDPERAEKFRQRAREFALDFWRYFDADGAAIPFGRSLTYRFAMSAFWASVVFSETEIPAPLSLGVIKGLLLRNLRWWSKKSDIFYRDGTLNIGLCYSNMYMSEDYNSPQSPYWCMKTFAAVGLPANHTFWTTPEEPHPLATQENNFTVKLLEQPKQILVDSGNHHFLLSSGQYCKWPLKATEAKYAKFAYSSAFGFSVPTGPLIQQIAPDSTLAISEDDGETWKTRWISEETEIGEMEFYGSRSKDGEERVITKLPTLVNRWSPSKRSPIEVETTLIPPTTRWPDWHVRIHKITSKSNSIEGLRLVEGGFAIYGRSSTGGVLPKIGNFKSMTDDGSTFSECTAEDESSSLIISTAGGSGIRQLSSTFGKGRGSVLKPDANTNLMVSRTLIPTIEQKIEGEIKDVMIVTAVFAISGAKLPATEIRKRWMDEPIVMTGDNPGEEAFMYVKP